MGDKLDRAVGVIGLGYVGLPVAVAFASRFSGTVGFDIDSTRVEELRNGHDRTREVATELLTGSNLDVTDDPLDLERVDFYIVTVPTPIDARNRPDLSALEAASRTVGRALAPGDIVVYESTVYPGVTEDVCGPILEESSGLTRGVDFTVGYSPERINPGDPSHRFEQIAKIVSAEDEATLEVVASMYGAVVEAGIHRAPSVAVAEAAKVIENTQRDLNIALVNELALIFDRLDIDTKSVLDAAATKWNFARYSPGLVGGHCIGVDPYYLTARAEEVGIQPRLILAGRATNNFMGEYVADATIKRLVRAGVDMGSCAVLVAGIAFKENVPDFRNTGAASVVSHLEDYGLDVSVWDPLCDRRAVRHEFGIELVEPGDISRYDAIVLAVPHDQVVHDVRGWLDTAPPPLLVDVKGAIPKESVPSATTYWTL